MGSTCKSAPRRLAMLAVVTCTVSCGSAPEHGRMSTAAGGSGAGGTPAAGTGGTSAGSGALGSGGVGAIGSSTGGAASEESVLDVSGDGGWAKAFPDDYDINAMARTGSGEIVLAVRHSMVGSVVKLDARGNVVWEDSPATATVCSGIAIAPDDSITVVCTVGEVFDRTPMLARYTSAGELIWSKRVAEGPEVVASALAQDAGGNLYLSGFVDGTTNFGDEQKTSLAEDGFLAKFTPDGTHALSRLYGDARRQWATQVVVAPDGSVVLGGDFEGAIDFGAGELRTRGFGVSNLFVTELTETAEPLRASRIVTGSTLARVTGLGAAADRVCAAGSFRELIELENRSVASLGSDDLFVTCLDRTGVPIFGRTFGGPELDSGGTLALDPDGTAMLGCRLNGPVLVGEETIGTPGRRVMALIEIDPQGGVVRHRAFAAGSLSNITSLVLEQDRVLFAGYFEAELALPIGTLRAEQAPFVAQLRR